MSNLTYKQVAEKLGKSVSFVKKLAQNGLIEVQDLGHRTKLISEEALAEYQRKYTRRAI